MRDTIAAIATSAGVGGVGIVRVSGPLAVPIVARLLGVADASLDRRVRVGWARDASGAQLDQVLAFAMRGPHSFTGEDVAELHGHGGAHNLGALLAAVLAGGARVAEPGEFTRRAVESGKLDLARAEALLGVIHAGSERAWRLAQQNLGGALGEAAAALETRALSVLAELEGAIDFPDEELDTRGAPWVASELGALASATASLASSFRHGRAVAQGITVALVGAVNVGKSSLLNALVGSERALVAPAPGTTRDWLEVPAVWSGVAVTVIDTAGLRETSDPVERRGIELGSARVAAADVVLVLDDGSGAPSSLAAQLATFGGRGIAVRSKSDLRVVATAGRSSPASAARGSSAASAHDRGAAGATAAAGAAGAAAVAAVASALRSPSSADDRAAPMLDGRAASGAAPALRAPMLDGRVAPMRDGRAAAVAPDGSAAAVVETSAITGAGLEELRARVLAMAGVSESEGSEHGLVTTARQHALAAGAAERFAAAASGWARKLAPELVALELRAAAQALAELRGVEVGERVLDEVFARFCIGK
ncbi:MAG TPA: GTPase [Kofleriaceae bacterium]|jgi:tRNA modification GTPase